MGANGWVIDVILRYKHSASPLTIVSCLVRHLDLVMQLIRRDVIGRYRGSFMGVLWSVVHPLIMLCVYLFVLRTVFNPQWDIQTNGPVEFALFLFAGLVVYSFFSDCVIRAPNLVLNHISYVKKIMFPLEVLPWVSLGSALFHVCVSAGVLLLCYGIIHLSLPWTVIFIPVLLLLLSLVVLGLSWFLASLGVYVRDVGQVVGVVTSMMLFLSPVFYPVSAIPAAYQPLMYLNPLTFQVEQMRNILILGKPLPLEGVIIYFLCSVLVAWLGLWWFQKTRKGFADVL